MLPRVLSHQLLSSAVVLKALLVYLSFHHNIMRNKHDHCRYVYNHISCPDISTSQRSSAQSGSYHIWLLAEYISWPCRKLLIWYHHHHHHNHHMLNHDHHHHHLVNCSYHIWLLAECISWPCRKISIWYHHHHHNHHQQNHHLVNHHPHHDLVNLAVIIFS